MPNEQKPGPATAPSAEQIEEQHIAALAAAAMDYAKSDTSLRDSFKKHFEALDARFRIFNRELVDYAKNNPDDTSLRRFRFSEAAEKAAREVTVTRADLSDTLKKLHIASTDEEADKIISKLTTRTIKVEPPEESTRNYGRQSSMDAFSQFKNVLAANVKQGVQTDAEPIAAFSKSMIFGQKIRGA